MADWTYGEDGRRFPVQPNQLWRVGDHWFACGDLEDGIGDRFFNAVSLTPDLSYSDPPWNKGNAKSFRTKAGVGRDVDFDRLLDLVVQEVKRSKHLSFIEMGMATVPALREKLIAHSGLLIGQWEITYYGKKPCMLLAVNFHGVVTIDLPEFSGLDDSKTPFSAIEVVRGLIKGQVAYVYDPCMGRGLTAEAAIKNEGVALGIELNPYRLSVTLSKVQHLIGEMPKLESVI